MREVEVTLWTETDGEEVGCLAYLDGDLTVVEVDDCDVAELLCLVATVFTCSSFLGNHVQSGAFEF
jgi:hypothetical protein